MLLLLLSGISLPEAVKDSVTVTGPDALMGPVAVWLTSLASSRVRVQHAGAWAPQKLQIS